MLFLNHESITTHAYLFSLKSARYNDLTPINIDIDVLRHWNNKLLHNYLLRIKYRVHPPDDGTLLKIII